ELERQGLKRGENGLKIIMMCEIPSNALLAEQFLEYFDGFSIGSNDMTQLALGLDRDSGVVSELFDERNDAVKALLAAGYRRPLCLHLPASQPATIRRRLGLERACREAGIEPDHLSHSYMGQGDEHYHDIPAVVLAHIREGRPGFDSVICGNDRIAFMVYQTLLGQGLRIPQDVAVVGYDNMVGIGDLFLPPLSTVQLPHYDIGRLSALHIIHGDNHRETRKVASPWLPRASH
ncbi:MAG: substrate-binding domain-containing protein, partial [Bradyrhizobium sp.]|nr:substrate-binding domain-containing protein [Bradyrhizobium sp.]